MNKKVLKLCLLLLIGSIVSLPGFAYASVNHDIIRLGSDVSVDQEQVYDEIVVIGGNASIAGHTDDVVIIGGNLYTSQTAVTNDIIVVGGTLTIDGSVNGDVVVIGGTVDLLSNAVIQQDIVLFTSTLSKAETTTINGNIINKNIDNLSDSVGNGFYLFGQYAPEIFLGFWVWFSISSGLLAILFGWLLGILLPNQTKSIAYTIGTQGLKSFAIGLLVKILAIPVAIALAITILGIPLIIVMLFVIWLAQYFGLAAFGYLIGRKLASQFNKMISFGWMLFIGLLIIALVKSVPVGGSIVYFVLKCIALGAVILSRFGTKQIAPPPLTDDLTDDLTNDPTN